MGDLSYPFSEAPAHGVAQQVADGLHWLRLPLPFALDHINVYLLESDEGWWLVDTGLLTPQTQQLWETIADAKFSEKPLLGVSCTHMHPDHVGMAGWLCDRWQVALHMTQAEYLSARLFSLSSPAEVPWNVEKHYREAGLVGEQIAAVARAFRGFHRVVSPIPTSYCRLRDGDSFLFGGRRWRVIVGRGHSPEHACFYSESLNVLLSGDQVIPRISSNVSVTAMEPRGNPLKDWMDSHERLLEALPSDVLVLPSHNLPFYGLHKRLRQLIDHHETHLLALEQACAEKPHTAVDLLPVMFRPLRDDRALALALGECLAHLNYLTERGQLARETDSSGQARYRSIDDTLALRLRKQAHVVEEAPLQV